MNAPSVGRIVHVVLAENIGGVQIHPSAVGSHRAALIVRTWDGVEPGTVAPYVNLQIFLDGSNDAPNCAGHAPLWANSVYYDEGGRPGSWHWPEQTPNS